VPYQQTVWIARHASRLDFVNPDWHRTASNPFDPPLSEEGAIQARQLGRRLSGEGIARIFSSPFLRAVETAHHVADVLDLPVEIEQGACEWLNPDWFPSQPEWTIPEALGKDFPRIAGQDASVVSPDYPETWQDMLTRTATVIRTLTDRTQEDILIIGHGASLLGFTRALVSGEPEINADFCALVKLARLKSRWQLELAGDTSFLERASGESRFI
jgi:broad specificity phosphatase PhoE